MTGRQDAPPWLILRQAQHERPLLPLILRQAQHGWPLDSRSESGMTDGGMDSGSGAGMTERTPIPPVGKGLMG